VTTRRLPVYALGAQRLHRRTAERWCHGIAREPGAIPALPGRSVRRICAPGCAATIRPGCARGRHRRAPCRSRCTGRAAERHGL